MRPLAPTTGVNSKYLSRAGRGGRKASLLAEGPGTQVLLAPKF